VARPAAAVPILSVKWIKNHAYLYEQTYVGPLRTGRPKYRWRYLGRVNDERAKAAKPEELRVMAAAVGRSKERRAAMDASKRVVRDER
jgi:hypothetical protein